jgi:hypothetical protein
MTSIFVYIQLAQRLYSEFGLKRSAASIFRAIKRIKFTRKMVKTKFFNPKPKSEYDFNHLDSALANSNSISLDESCFYVYDHPRFGYSKRGESLVKNIPSTCLYPRKASTVALLSIPFSYFLKKTT